MYDITKAPTFENVPRWLRELKDHANRDIVRIEMGAQRSNRMRREVERGRTAGAEPGRAIWAALRSAVEGGRFSRGCTRGSWESCPPYQQAAHVTAARLHRATSMDGGRGAFALH